MGRRGGVYMAGDLVGMSMRAMGDIRSACGTFCGRRQGLLWDRLRASENQSGYMQRDNLILQ